MTQAAIKSYTYYFLVRSLLHQWPPEDSYFAKVHLASMAPYDKTRLRYKIKNKNLSFFE